MNIGYLSECPEDYSKGLAAQDTRAKLRRFMTEWRPLADDAYRIVHSMTLHDFRVFRDGLRKERRGRFAGAQWMRCFGDVLLPEVMFHASIVASHYKVPWGTAFIRLVEVGRIRKSPDGIYIVAVQTSAEVPQSAPADAGEAGKTGVSE